MFELGSCLVILLVASTFGDSNYWARWHDLLNTEQATEGEQRRHILFTEAVAYVGAIVLLLAQGTAAISQRLNGVTNWEYVSVSIAAVFLLVVGIIVRRGPRARGRSSRLHRAVVRM